MFDVSGSSWCDYVKRGVRKQALDSVIMKIYDLLTDLYLFVQTGLRVMAENIIGSLLFQKIHLQISCKLMEKSVDFFFSVV